MSSIPVAAARQAPHTQIDSSPSTPRIPLVAAAIGAGAIAISALVYWINRRQRLAVRVDSSSQTTSPEPLHAEPVHPVSASPSSAGSTSSSALHSPERLLRLSACVPFFSPSIELRNLPGRGVGFVATKSITPGELLLIDSVLSTHTSNDVAYDWQAQVSLVKQLYEKDPEAVEELYVSEESIAEVSESHPIPEQFRSSPIPSVSDATWQRYLHAMSNNTYIVEEGDPEVRMSEIVSEGEDGTTVTTFQAVHVLRYTLNLHFITCKINHSCYPNACLSGGRVWACGNIKEGDEVCVSYLLPEQGLYLPTIPRQAMLSRARHFHCTCIRCSGGSRTMRQLEHVLQGGGEEGNAAGSFELDPADPEQVAAPPPPPLTESELDALHARIEDALCTPDEDRPDFESQEFRELCDELDQMYTQLPASHWIRFTLRRRILINPPEWIKPRDLMRFLLEHYCVIQMILPQSHPYKIFEIEELFEGLERSGKILIQDLSLIFPRIDPAFDRETSVLFRLDEDPSTQSFKNILDARFPSVESRAAEQRELKCTVRGCERGEASRSGESALTPEDEEQKVSMDSSIASSSTHDSSILHSPSGSNGITTFVCTRCEIPLVACSSECHYVLLQYHEEICSLLSLTRS